MIAVRNLVHQYDGSRALNLPQWEAGTGSRWLVLGPSGSGKTTFLHILAGLVRPTAGEVVIERKQINSLSSTELDRWRGANVGIVLQALHLVAHLSVHDNLRLAQYLARVPQRDEAIALTLAALGVGDKAARRPHQLSQGEQQRVAIARAVVNGPKVLLADEPTANLDDAAASRAIELLVTAADRRGATLVVATHDSRVKPHFSNILQL